jgi:hypothetical protein
MAETRTASVTVFAILNIVFGLLWLTCAGGEAVLESVVNDFRLKQGENPAVEKWQLRKRLERQFPLNPIYEVVAIGLGIGLAAVLVLAGIGLWKMRDWGRSLSLAWAVLTMLYRIGQLVYNATVLGPVTLKITQDYEAANQAVPLSFSVRVVAVMTMVTAFLIIYPAILLIFMLLPNTAEAFATTVKCQYSADRPNEDGNRDHHRQRHDQASE